MNKPPSNPFPPFPTKAEIAALADALYALRKAFIEGYEDRGVHVGGVWRRVDNKPLYNGKETPPVFVKNVCDHLGDSYIIWYDGTEHDGKPMTADEFLGCVKDLMNFYNGKTVDNAEETE